MKTSRKYRGASIVEGAAAMTMLLPIVFLVIFASVEISYLYVLKSSLVEVAREAARNLAIAYGQNPAVAGSRSLQDSLVLSRLRVPNVVNSERQFDNPIFTQASDPPTVTVTVRYTGNQYGLPPFPNPDPLHLGSGIAISSTSTYRLQ